MDVEEVESDLLLQVINVSALLACTALKIPQITRLLSPPSDEG